MKFNNSIALYYFLGVTLLNSVNSFTMEIAKPSITQQVESLRDIFDAQLGINPAWYCRPFIGTMISLYQTSFLTAEQIKGKIKEIDTCIKQHTANYNNSQQEKNDLIIQLLQLHFYVSYTMQAAVDQKVENFKEPHSYSLLNELLRPDFTQDETGVYKIIHEQATADFIEQSHLKKSLEHVKYDRSGDIHFTVIYASDKPLLSNTMKMSEDGKLLKINDSDNNTFMWYTTSASTANTVPTNQTLLRFTEIKWSSGCTPHYMHNCIIDRTGTYAAFNISQSNIPVRKNYQHRSIATIDQCALPVDIDNNGKSAIVLFTRPTTTSYVCQKFFKTNKENIGQLKLFKKSPLLQQIEGYPQQNLINIVNARIKKLESLGQL